MTDVEPPSDVVVLVDVANVMGSRPDGWWRDRRAAATRLLTAFGQLPGLQTVGPDGRQLRIARVVAVLEGAARGAAAQDSVDIVEAERDGDSTIVAVTEELVASGLASVPETDSAPVVLVVTADRGLRERLRGTAQIAGPQWLNELIGR